MKLLRSAAIGMLVLSACIGIAKPPFLKIFLATYKVDPNSELGKAKCLTCHMPPAPPKRNPYGRQVQAALAEADARMITPQMLKSIEGKDADGDGFTNIQEIRAGSLPGNPKSTPKTKVKPKPKAKPHKKKVKSAMMDLPASAGLAFFAMPAVVLGLVRRSNTPRLDQD